MERVALLSPADREEALAALTSALSPDLIPYYWPIWARPSQLPPPALTSPSSRPPVSVWLFLAGRGAGKTRAAAEHIASYARDHPHVRIGLLGRTAADTRDVLVTGDSGLLNVGPPDERPTYRSSTRQVLWPNGAQATLFSADVPDALRGPQFHIAWADEIATYPQITGADGLTAWDNLRIATRLGAHPYVVATTTPKRIPLIRALLDDDSVVVSHARTRDNLANLSAQYIETIYGLYDGTSLAAQELEGVYSETVEGALWVPSTIDANRVAELPASLKLPIRFTGVDPSVSDQPKDECGIVTIYAEAVTHASRLTASAYVVADDTVHGPPSLWAKRAAETARFHQSVIVAESNQGGELVRLVLQHEAPDVPVFLIRSSVSKAQRAEPVALLYEKERVHHVNTLPDLESQQTSWVPSESRKSPDRCLPPDAPVTLPDGSTAPISGIRPGDTVLTRFGPRRVLASERTSRSERLLTLTLSDGRTFTGTPNHPVLTSLGWSTLDALNFDDTIIMCPVSNLQSRSSTTENSGTEIRTQMRHDGIACTTEIARHLANDFMYVSMKTRTDPNPQVRRSITPITTRTTTDPRTSLRLLPVNTLERTSLLNDSPLFERISYVPRFPQPQKRNAQILMHPLEHRAPQSKDGRMFFPVREHALSAVRYSSPVSLLERSSSALENAATSTTAFFMQTIPGHSFAHTLDADERRNDRGSRRLSDRGTAPSLARARIVGIASELRKSETWNLTIEGVHEYIAYGVVTHNCDALVFAITAALIRRPPGYYPGSASLRTSSPNSAATRSAARRTLNTRATLPTRNSSQATSYTRIITPGS